MDRLLPQPMGSYLYSLDAALKASGCPPNYPPRNQEVNSPNGNIIGHWTELENAKYCAFLSKFKEKFGEKSARRQWKVFKSLADFMNTRNANQCRSHHHKMKKNFASTEEIIQFLKSKHPRL